jgi:hypothetical protein
MMPEYGESDQAFSRNFPFFPNRPGMSALAVFQIA